MTLTITCTAGLGETTGKLVAFDRAAALALTGLASWVYATPVTGRLTTLDGHTALATDATGTVSSGGAVTLMMDTDTDAMLVHMGPGRARNYSALLTVWATATGAVCCRAEIPLVMGAKAVTTV